MNGVRLRGLDAEQGRGVAAESPITEEEKSGDGGD